MSRRSSDDGCEGAIIKAIAQVLATLILFAIAAAWEFGLNPSNNYSVEMEGEQVAIVDGVNCHGDGIPWRLTIIDTWYFNKKTYAKLLIWKDYQGHISDLAELEVKSSSQLSLESCSGEFVDVALVWDIGSLFGKSMHLRVHPPFEVQVLSDVQIPNYVKEK